MAKQTRKLQQVSQADILLKEQMQAIDRAAADARSGVIDDATYKSRIAEVLATSENLDKARQGRLALKASEAVRIPVGSGSRGAIVLSGNRTVAPTLETMARPSDMLGGNIRVPVVRLPQTTMPNPLVDAAAAASLSGQQQSSQAARVAEYLAQEAQRGAVPGRRAIVLRGPQQPGPIDAAVEAARMNAANQAASSARVATAIPKVEQAVSKIRIPGYFGSSAATANPAVGEAVARLKASKTPVQVARRGRTAFEVARGAAEENAGKAVAGKGLLAAGGAAVMALLASKIFGGDKEQIDPQVQLALAQRLGQGQDNGAGTSKQLMDMSRALTIVKKLQDLAAVQGPAAMAKPRLF